MSRFSLAVILVVSLLTAASASAVPPDDLSGDPLDRGALLALPAIYQLRTVVTAEALVTDDGSRVPLPPGARRIGELGTAFGVAPGGYVVAATHVAEPFGESLAVAARINQRAVSGQPHSEDIAREWVRETGGRAVGVRVVNRSLAQADGGGGPAASRRWRPIVVRAERDSDLTLLRIPAPSAPALALDESRTIGTPIATLGYGGPSPQSRSPLEPTARPGALGRTGTAKSRPGRRLLEVTTGVEKGDSGGPAVDGEGRVHGVVVLRSERGGIVEPASAVRDLLGEAGITPRSTPSTDRFAAGMRRFWALDFAEAATLFDATRSAFPDHTLAAHQRDRATALAAVDVTLAGTGSHGRGFLLAFGVLAAVAASACAIGLGVLGWNGLVQRERQRGRAPKD